ncbi:hypothetical protein TNCV_2985351 [Trichonephila clavipes]|nr:hypothetical protein TNCV_2985351 [Trichonephila clavipes]
MCVISTRNSNSIAQQPMRPRAYRAYPSMRDHWALRCIMSLSGGQSEAKPPMFQASSKLGTHLSAHCRKDERLSRPCRARG